MATLFEGVGLAELVVLLRKRFGDRRLYFTFLASSGGYATFAQDNIKALPAWLQRAERGVRSGRGGGVAVVVRVFLDDKAVIKRPDGEFIIVPKKQVYHFLVDSRGTTAFSEAETRQAQNTDAASGLPLPEEADIVYSSSEHLLRNLLSE